ncbi:MAG: septum formation inhibitor Maf [Oscillospiraceae bacterium]|nr:septum formation inhibitor Maf [Oscillospiraceae bacterium]
MSIVLASASPRRRELLEMMGLKFEILPAKDELDAEGLSPAEAVAKIALGKAMSVAKLRDKDDLVIAADTLVCLDGELLGKPKDEDEAFEMLKKLSGNEHQVYTGIAVSQGAKHASGAEMTKVRFCKMSDEDIRNYIATFEPMDKAGAYGIQGKGAVFIEGIEGDYFNVMGLPLHKLSLMLKDFGFSLL